MSRETTKQVAPISPDELVGLQRELMPPEVIETFNRYIGERALNGRAVINQDDIVEDLKSQGLDGGDIFEKGWLNVEGIYKDAGWKVEYNAPAYNETGRSYFTFTVPNEKA